jgi:hypothetical protein
LKEDGPDVMSSEGDSDHSDHGEMWTDAECYTSEMLGEDGNKKRGRVMVTPEQATCQRELAKSALSAVQMPALTSSEDDGGRRSVADTEDEDPKILKVQPPYAQMTRFAM